MNVMAQAHKHAKLIIARYKASGVSHDYSYREILASCLKVAHKKYKEVCERMQTAFRNLYKFTCLDTKKVVAFITARNMQQAVDLYKEKGKALTTYAEQMSFGYPKEVCDIYH